MKKIICIFLTCSIIFTAIFLFLNIEVATQQGINYQCHTTKIPLFLKILNFFDRHYNYKELSKRITKDARTDEERAVKLFEWTYNNIKRVPEGMPVIDDHVWYTIIRGYGTDDQFQDIFATLCNYANLDAFFTWLYSSNNQIRKPFSFIRLGKEWSGFDIYNGIYFINSRKKIATVMDLSNGNWRTFSLSGNLNLYDYYAAYFENLKSVDFQNWRFTRASIQSPINRLIFWNKNKNK